MQRNDFFIVMPRALVSLARTELETKWPAIEAHAKSLGLVLDSVELNIEEGPDGLELKNLPTDLGLALNLCLKIPTRILLRLTEFRCRDFPKLFKKTLKFDWNRLLGANLPQVKVSAQTSRLMHHKRIAATVEDALKKLASQSSSNSREIEAPIQTLYVRFSDDTCQFSLDTSGDPLYKRWGAKDVGQAPLRETLAAALFFKFSLCVKPLDVDAILLDPMAGSGTFLIEAQNFSKAQFRRTYGFLLAPKLAEHAEQILKFAGQELMNLKWVGEGIGLERDIETFGYLQKNLAEFSNAKALNLDFFDCNFGFLSNSNSSVQRLVLLNPPYGRRIQILENLSTYYQKLLQRIATDVKPHHFGLIVPFKLVRNCREHLKDYRCKLEFPFENGGLKVVFLVFCVKG